MGIGIKITSKQLRKQFHVVFAGLINKSSSLLKNIHNKYPAQIKSASIFGISFFITIGILSLSSISHASWNGFVTWDSKADFDSNAVSTGAATTNSLADTTTSSGSVKLIKPNDNGSTISAGNTNSLMVKNDGTVWATGIDNTDESLVTTASHTGTGTDDMVVSGAYSGNTPDPSFTVIIDGTNTIKTSTLSSGGSGYAANDTFSINNGTVLATGRILTVSAGAVSTYEITTNGAGYWVASSFTTTNIIGSGSGLTINVTEIVSTFKWKKDSEAFTEKVPITGTAQLLKEGMYVQFGSTTGHNSADNFVISHSAAGGVAPVDKTVTYGVVRTSIGGSDKYWITQNLGADHQATSATDSSEASGGWYWQFNRKQGYKYTTERTPSSAWTTPISETVVWSAATDPCTIELGASWNIPAKAEWDAADGAPQSWTNYNHTYASVLKLHAAGLLDYSTGVLSNRGALGRYWSPSYNNATNARPYYISSSSASTESIYANKANGFSTRCLTAAAPTPDQWTFSAPTSAEVINNNEFTQIATDSSSATTGAGNTIFIIKQDGTAVASGLNANGQLGLGDTTNRSSFTTVPGLSNIKQVSNNSTNSIALKNDGTVWVTGQNANGELGLGNTTQVTSWTQVPGITTATQIATGSNSSYMVKSDGSVWVTGLNSSGQLGLNDTTTRTSWTQAATLSDIKLVSSYGTNALALTNTGTVWGTGSNGSGSLGTSASGQKNVWTESVITGASNLSTGADHSLAIKNDGSVWAIGKGSAGALGTENTSDQTTWIQIDITGAESVSAGLNHSIIRKDDGTTLIFGDNSKQQLGIVGGGTYSAPATSLSNIKKSGGYLSTATISSLKFDIEQDDLPGTIAKWESIGWEATTPTGSAIKFRSRSASTDLGLSSATWSDYYTTSGDTLTSARSRWIEIEMTLLSTNGTNAPTLDSFTVYYSTDKTAPLNPTNPASAWKDSSKVTTISDNSYTNDNRPYFEFLGASDEENGSGLKGYYVYFGTSDSADPYTAGSYQAHSSSEPQTFTPSTDILNDRSYYLRVRTVDNSENRSDPETIFTYKYDATNPVSPSTVTVSPFGWSRDNDFSFEWSTGFDEALYASGINRYEYKVGGSIDDWTGDVLSTTLLTVENIESYKNGQNTFYVRAVDNAGNVSTPRQVYYYYNGEAPSAPQNLTVNPQSSTTINSFTFEWDKPASYNGEIKGYRYSINASPEANNTTFLNLSDLPSEATYNPTTGHVTLSDIPAATLQGFNYFYIVAVDTNDNVAYGNDAVRVGFECNTPAPGIPIDPEIFDTSNRDKVNYSVAIKWTAPANKGVGFKEYVIERSTDGETFVENGTSTDTSYINTGLESIEYHYRILTRDNSGNTSAPSELISTTPTGKYTTAPTITVQPTSEARVTTATINWVTNRVATSFVAASTNAEFDPAKNLQGQQDYTIDHTVNLAGLQPDTVYHYKVIYTDEDGNSNIDEAEDFIFRTQPAPRVERVSTLDIRLNTAIITWYTSEPATADILYGKTSNYSTTIENVSGGSTTVHSIRLEKLDHSSTYHFAIRIKDVDGNVITSDDYAFDTLMYPVVSNVRFDTLKDKSTSTFKITWDSNVLTNSIVRYQLDGGAVEESVKTALDTKHEIIVSNLLDNRYYAFTAIGHDQYGNEAISDVQRVKTDYDTRPPLIFNITNEVSSIDFGASAKSQLVVSWETDEPTTSQVEYGLGATGENYDTKSQIDTGLTTSHVVILTGLRPSSAYHFRTISNDASDNKSTSDVQSILTEQSRSSIMDVIVGSLQSSIGWLFGMRN